MGASVHPLMTDGIVLKFRTRRFTSPVARSSFPQSVGLDTRPAFDCPVALLVDSLTASSAEMVMLCFRGQERTRVFGMPTAGYTSGNQAVSDAGRFAARPDDQQHARPHRRGLLQRAHRSRRADQPDLEDALAWLREERTRHAGIRQ